MEAAYRRPTWAGPEGTGKLYETQKVPSATSTTSPSTHTSGFVGGVPYEQLTEKLKNAEWFLDGFAWSDETTQRDSEDENFIHWTQKIKNWRFRFTQMMGNGSESVWKFNHTERTRWENCWQYGLREWYLEGPLWRECVCINAYYQEDMLLRRQIVTWQDDSIGECHLVSYCSLLSPCSIGLSMTGHCGIS